MPERLQRDGARDAATGWFCALRELVQMAVVQLPQRVEEHPEQPPRLGEVTARASHHHVLRDQFELFVQSQVPLQRRRLAAGGAWYFEGEFLPPVSDHRVRDFLHQLVGEAGIVLRRAGAQRGNLETARVQPERLRNLSAVRAGDGGEQPHQRRVQLRLHVPLLVDLDLVLLVLQLLDAERAHPHRARVLWLDGAAFAGVAGEPLANHVGDLEPRVHGQSALQHPLRDHHVRLVARVRILVRHLRNALRDQKLLDVDFVFVDLRPRFLQKLVYPFHDAVLREFAAQNSVQDFLSHFAGQLAPVSAHQV
mmetsp:Transcript_9071/g.22218  ORF Transcript_9071/g.22218 Transcript_9071/m.22218 type:complete len:308 (-) Transcript_9071:2833-3756(-)